jgi:hypothetical protein
VYILANTFSGNGTISATGGGGGNAGQYAALARRRIVLHYTTDSSTYTITAKSGSTNGPTYVTGGSGTIYRETGGQNVLLDNCNLAPE